jgi:hypothetical protein
MTLFYRRRVVSNSYEKFDFSVDGINDALTKARNDIKNAFHPIFEKTLTTSSELHIFYPENALNYLDNYCLECMKTGLTNVKALATAIGYTFTNKK